MSRILFIACSAFCVFAGGSAFLVEPAVAQTQGESVRTRLTDSEPRVAMPKLSDSAVFQFLIRGHSAHASAAPAVRASATPTAVGRTDAGLAAANFIQEDEIQPVEPPPAPRPRGERAAQRVDEGIEPLKSQTQLFSSLWGENDAVEAPNRYPFDASVAAGVPLGPDVRTVADPVYGERLIAGTFYTWAAPAFFHNPLYFEQVNLERYGQGPHHLLQPAYSAAHFFATIPKLPYHLAATPPCEQVYTLGHYRPGNGAPYQWHLPRPSWKGLVVQGIATAGTAVAIP